MPELHHSAAYGGPGWSPRKASLSEEIGHLWSPCGVSTEWSDLKSVLLHEPGDELTGISDPDAWQLLEPIDWGRAQVQHRALAKAYREAGVTVHYVDPAALPPPNQLFVADLMFMTPEGAILGRPASTVRAGEELHVASRLATMGIPILKTVRGCGTFEGADAAWIDSHTVLLATGLRTNAEGAAQAASLLSELGVRVVHVGLPFGAMHLMGLLRFADRDLALAWPGRIPYAAVEALRMAGYRVLFLPDEGHTERRVALNFVTLGPRRILMAEGHPLTQAFLEDAGIECLTVGIDELARAAGGIACLTGVVQREI